MAAYIAKELILKNKIAKYDTWNNNETILVPGELAIVKLTVGDKHPITEKACENDSYLIKVGDGEHSFKNLPWLESSANIELYGDEESETYNPEDSQLYKNLSDIGKQAASVYFIQSSIESLIGQLNTEINSLKETLNTLQAKGPEGTEAFFVKSESIE